MKFLIRTLAIILAVINTLFALLMLATAYADRIEALYTPEGKGILNAKNLESLA